MSYGYKNLISAFNPHIKYHDDMYNEEVKILKFPYMHMFGDFRVFNGIQLQDVDEILGQIRQIMINIANLNAENEREERLRGERNEWT